jgi:hypothetical protein
MLEIFGQLIRKGAVPVVDVKQVVGEIVVGDVNILPAIVIDVNNRNRVMSPSIKIFDCLDTSVNTRWCRASE